MILSTKSTSIPKTKEQPQTLRYKETHPVTPPQSFDAQQFAADPLVLTDAFHASVMLRRLPTLQNPHYIKQSPESIYANHLL
jgi:hypothetical protein